MAERPSSTLAKLARALRRDADLPVRERIAKGLRFGAATALAPVYLSDCDRVGARTRTIGRPLVQNFGRIAIGCDAILSSTAAPIRLCTAAGAEIAMGDHVIVNYGVSFAADSKITIGDRVAIGPHSRICDYEGGTQGDAAPIVIGSDVWLTVRVKVLRGSTIGAGSIITAGSVVSGEIPAGVIAGGVPARVLRKRGEARPVPASRRASGASRAHEVVHATARAFAGIFGRARLAGADEIGESPVVRGEPYVRNLGSMAIGARLRLASSGGESHLVTGPRGRLEIGDDVTIGSSVGIDAEDHVRIGHRVSIGDLVMIMDTNFHGTDDFMAASETAAVIIEDDVRIGSEVTILKGTHIGRGARIAPGSVVSGVIPSGVLAAGVLARVIDAPAPAEA